MKSLLGKLWRWSWLVTLPVTIVFVYWGSLTWHYFSTFGVRYDAYPTQVELNSTGTEQFRFLVRRLELAVTHPIRGFADEHRLPFVSLHIPEASLAHLDEYLPHSGAVYVKGRLLVDERLAKVQVRYRGDTIQHWGSPKKSLRIKTDKDDLFEGMRKFNLMAPKSRFMIENHVSYELARSLGVIAPRSQVVDVVVNGELRGVHVLVEQIDELMLREHGLMPGDIYAGELFGKDAYTGVSDRLFEHPGLWEKIAENNHFAADSIAPLERLLGLLDEDPSPSVDRALEEILDIEAWATFGAFETLAQSAHTDLVHNWRLYYDPWKCRFAPILWDPIGWIARSGSDMPVALDRSRTPLHRALYRNSRFLHAKHRVISNFYAGGGDRELLRRVDDWVAKMEASIDADPYLAESPEQAKQSLEEYAQRIEATLASVRAGVLEDNGDVEYQMLGDSSTQIALEVNGHRPLRSLTAHFTDLISGPVSASVSYWVDGAKQTVDVSGAVSIRSNAVRLDVPLRAAFAPSFRDDDRLSAQEIGPGYYELELGGLSKDSSLMALEIDRGRDSGEMAARVDRIQPRAFRGTYNVVQPNPRASFTAWSGDVTVRGVVQITDDLVIEPGTVVRLEPSASLLCHGRVVAEGTTEKHIVFRPADAGQAPWGTVAIVGPRANNSVLTHCQFSGGSGYKDAGGMFEYSAMLSIHDVQGVRISHSAFRDNKLVDDMVHTVYSDVVIEDSSFTHSRFDALDLDISKAVLRNNRFEDSGNDAVDLMTTDAVIVGTTILRSGDKAVSVGEGSRLLSINSRFEHNAIGIQSKDRSVVTLVNADIAGNARALDAFKKAWQYGAGGRMYVYQSRLLRNDAMVTADKDSSIRIDNCSHDKPIVDDRVDKRVVVDRTSSSGDSRSAASGGLRRHPEEADLMQGFTASWWDLVDPGVRGTFGAEYRN